MHGPARNPWDPERTPGGSSGGAAAAVAAGMVPLAHGNDGGGSLRIPAACCGLVGLKAQRHRVSTAPDLGASPLVIDGVLTRTVAETAALLDVLAGYETGDAAWIPPPAEPFARSRERAPRGLRIGFTTLPPIPDAPVDPACAAAVERAAALAEGLGHGVEEVDRAVAERGAGRPLPRLLRGADRGRDPLLGDDRGPRGAHGDRHGADELGDLGALPPHRRRPLPAPADAAAGRMRALVAFLEPYDALITPALAQRPLPLGSLDTAARRSRSRPSGARAISRPSPRSSTRAGQPALSLPLFDGDDGLPLAVQLVGRPAGEGALLALAAALEAAAPRAARAGRRSADAEHGGHRARLHAERSASRMPAAGSIETSISSASSQVANARRPISRSVTRSARETIGAGM